MISSCKQNSIAIFPFINFVLALEVKKAKKTKNTKKMKKKKKKTTMNDMK